MQNLDRDRIDFGKGEISDIFIKMLVPTLLGLAFSALFLLTDGIFVGHGIGSDALASVNLVMPIFTLETAIGMMFAIGASVAASVHLAKGNVKAARIFVTQAFWAVLILGAILALVLYLFPSAILKLLGTSDALMESCHEYYLWFAPCGLFVMLQFVAQFVIRVDGNPKFASLVEIVPACFNMFLDWLFIFPCGMGLMGAALATSIGSFMGVLMGIYYMLFKRRTLALYRLKRTVTSLVLSLRNIWHMARIGFSGFLGEFSVSVLTLVANMSFMNLLGKDGVAAFSVACYLAPVVYMICAAIAQSAQPIISFNYGKGDMGRVRKAMRLSVVCGAAVGGAMTLLLVFFAGGVTSIFLEKGTPVFDLCLHGLPIYASGFVFMGICVTAIGYLQGVEKSVKSTVYTFLRGMGFPVAAFLILPGMFGADGLWMAVPVSELLTAIIIACLAHPVSKAGTQVTR